MSFLKWIDIERLIHSIKTVIAVLIAIVLTRLIGFKADQWIVITILVLMCAQIYVGSVFQKGYLRFFGTCVGCLIGISTFLIFGDSLFVIALTICFSSFIFSYIATGNERFTYACTLGAVTTALIMLSHDPTVTYAVQRFLEISSGILIATVISQFVLPIHAKTHLRRTQAKTLTEMRNYYQTCVINQDDDLKQHDEFEENLVKLLSKQRQLAKEAKREPFGSDFNPERCIQLLAYEKEILRAIDFMHLAMVNIQNGRSYLAQLPIFQSFNQNIIANFNELITAVEQTKPVAMPIQTQTLETLKTTLVSNLSMHPEQERIYIYSLCFTAEILISHMQKLALLFDVSLRDEQSIANK